MTDQPENDSWRTSRDGALAAASHILGSDEGRQFVQHFAGIWAGESKPRTPEIGDIAVSRTTGVSGTITRVQERSSDNRYFVNLDNGKFCVLPDDDKWEYGSAAN